VIIFLYLLRGLLLRLSIALPAVTAVYAAFDLGDRGRRLAQDLGWAPVLEATLLHLPLVAVQVLPAALMLAIALWLGALRQRGELEALATHGAAPITLGLPLLAVGVGCATAALLVGELLVPACEAAAERRTGVVPSALTGTDREATWLKEARWLLKRRGAHVLALELTDTFAVRQRVEGRASRDPGALEGVRIVRFAPPAVERRKRLHLAPLAATAALWRAPRPEAQPFGELQRRLASRSSSGHGLPVETLLLHSKLAYPLINVLIAVFGLALALCRRDLGPLAEVAAAAALLLASWLALAACFVAARAGWISPALGAWLPLGLGMIGALAVVGYRTKRG
jgi:lipopolysaccharide export LptBFGC system permease protein LptF